MIGPAICPALGDWLDFGWVGGWRVEEREVRVCEVPSSSRYHGIPCGSCSPPQDTPGQRWHRKILADALPCLALKCFQLPPLWTPHPYPRLSVPRGCREGGGDRILLLSEQPILSSPSSPPTSWHLGTADGHLWGCRTEGARRPLSSPQLQGRGLIRYMRGVRRGPCLPLPCAPAPLSPLCLPACPMPSYLCPPTSLGEVPGSLATKPL